MLTQAFRTGRKRDDVFPRSWWTPIKHHHGQPHQTLHIFHCLAKPKRAPLPSPTSNSPQVNTLHLAEPQPQLHKHKHNTNNTDSKIHGLTANCHLIGPQQRGEGAHLCRDQEGLRRPHTLPAPRRLACSRHPRRQEPGSKGSKICKYLPAVPN